MTVLHLDYTYMQQPPSYNGGGRTEQKTVKHTMSIGEVIGSTNTDAMGKKPGKRPGRKPSKIDERAKLERSRQSARECRARKKLRYQYLEELVLNREKAVYALREELETYTQWCLALDKGGPVPDNLIKAIVNNEIAQKNQQIRLSQQLLQRQQRQQQRIPSSQSSTSSSPPTTSQQHEIHKTSSPESQLQRYLPNLSPPLQPAQTYSQMQAKQLSKHQPSTGPLLVRQQAFDMSYSEDIPSSSQMIQSNLVHPTNSASSSTSHLLFPQTTASSTQPSLAAQQRSHLQFGPRVHSEPPFHYEGIQQTTNYMPGVQGSPTSSACASSSNVQFRARSSSNPSTFMSYRRANVNTSNPHSINTPKSQTATVSSLGLGLFSGTEVSNRIPSFVTADEGSSSDENIDSQELFQLSAQNKRLATQPLFKDSSKRLQAVAPIQNINQSQNFDALDSFVNITNFGLSSTSSSPLSFGTSPIRTASPSSIKYSGRITPSSTTSSPAPSSTMSSVMEFAQSPLTYPSFERTSHTSSCLPPTCISSDVSADTSMPISSLAAELSASNPEPFSIYSYLDDLSNLPSLSSLFTGDTSNQNVTATGSNQPPASDPSYLNVPNIIDEYLD
ncbi:hypothetical protein BgiMline_035839 [Biomphalaria glabrata]|uniref:Uncharacterized protein LOC106073157 isoform X1 n=2 Tax=Biomphalaria glabrata TaxID=6526 RepID=A0A9W2Z8U4_BIOGL|nr:uncharacterized protein LOC106073157 isoform X1 [Biomphalaria glabrata]XP_055871407.1 uncharacterized protein LOC106073157 isoform X1 [Biomphalaria glabrata]XP_055871408.1 uncharacterized protein LOC106073157 isoform X1 [Biomphalaria glabrata]XP_055871409.1 uncharacterized protein LOC106073157 isoform X1 [Biomphalaria glabrata]XP_055871410.1 uncharacterized protein LOC106073157 isoform X1 [Biomphalaria glabrata]